MADTGAPWFIPYAEPTDLVRDWPDLSEDVADAVAAGLSSASTIAQVVYTLKNDAFSTTNTSFTDITGLTVTITPTTNTSTILLIANISYGSSATDFVGFMMTDNSNVQVIPPASGSAFDGLPALNGSAAFERISIIGRASPGTTSPVTYKVRLRAGGTGNTAYVNRNGGSSFGASTLTAIEIKP